MANVQTMIAEATIVTADEVYRNGIENPHGQAAQCMGNLQQLLAWTENYRSRN